MKEMVPSFQYQKLIKIPCNSKEWHQPHYVGDRSMEFLWFRRLSPCRKVCCNQDGILLSSEHGKVWLSQEQERAVLIFLFGTCGRPVQFWASSVGLPVQIPALCRNDSSVQELGTNGTGKAAYYWPKSFHHLQPAHWVHNPKIHWNFGDWITLDACIACLLQSYSGVCSEQILLIRDKGHHSLVGLFHFANYVTGSNL